VIRSEQLRVFEQNATRQFEDEMMAHSHGFAPLLCEIIGDEQLRVAIRSAITRATTYGFTNRGPVRLFVELTFLWGSAFDTDPQYRAIQSELLDSKDQMQRAERIYEGFLEYLEKASGPGAANVHRALRNLLAFARASLTFSEAFAGDMVREMRRLFPEKADYVGESGLRAIIEEAVDEACQYRFEADRHRALIVVLKFAFGHGATNDPLYPWIERTLKDERLEPEGRATRLEKKALTWLEHVVERNARELGA
jgi:hypothetical protein